MPGCVFDATRHVDAEGPHLADRDADVERVQAAGEDDFAARARARAAASQSVVWPLPLTGPSNSTRRGSAQAGVRARPHHRQHAQRARQVERRRCRRCRSAGCRAGSHAGSRRPRSRVGWRVTATQATLRRAGAASSAARCVRHLAHRGREHETDRIDFAGQRRAHRDRRRHAADLDERPRVMRAPARPRRAPTPPRGLARAWRARAPPDPARTSARCRPARGRSRRRPCARRLRQSRRRSRRRACTSAGSCGASASSRPGTTLSVARSREFTPTSNRSRCVAARVHERMRELDVRRVEGFEQHEHVAARARCR